MKKTIRVIALIMAVAMVLSVLAGCSLFGRNMAKYRSQTALIVGDEEVSVGKVMDTINNYYYTYASYISSGSITMDSVVSMAMDSIYQAYSKVDAYKNMKDVATYPNNTYADNAKYANSTYLTEEEMQFVLQNVKYNLYTSFDLEVETYIEAEIGKLYEESEEDDRAFFEYDDMNGATTYAEKVYKDNFVNKDMTEYFEKFYSYEGYNPYSADYNDYVYTDKALAQAKVDDINERLKKYVIENDGEKSSYPTITADKLIDYQTKAIKKLGQSVENTYEINLDVYFKEQVESKIVTVIVAKYDYSKATVIESDKAKLQKELTSRFDLAKGNTEASLNQNPDSYIDFVEALTDTSFIYDIPTIYQNSYIYVKNLLIPFSDEQLAQLKILAQEYGSETSPQYLKAREQMASEIVAKDFNNDEAEIEGFFTYSQDNGLQLAGELATLLPNDGSVTPKEFEELMARFNTDVGQHSTLYDYVVRISKNPIDDNPDLAPEYVVAANDAEKLGEYHYSVAVTKFGVHIVYFTGYVTAWESFDASKIYDTTTNEYRFLKAYYEDTLKILTTEWTDALNEEYKYQGKIKATSMLNTLIADYGAKYDFNEAMKEPEEEESEKE